MLINPTKHISLPSNHSNQCGFTMFELAIVMVVVSLLVGGTLVGKDLIKAATARRAVSQITMVQSAVNNFSTKYSGTLPGDMETASSLWSSAVDGDGDGKVDGDPVSPVVLEPYNFWHQLYVAGLIQEQFSPASINPDFNDSALHVAPELPYEGVYMVPHYETGGYNLTLNTNYIAIYATQRSYLSFNYLAWVLSLFGGTTPFGLLPSDAQIIDDKIDDGLANGGSIAPILPSYDWGDYDCMSAISNGSSKAYNTTSNFAACGLLVRLGQQ